MQFPTNYGMRRNRKLSRLNALRAVEQRARNRCGTFPSLNWQNRREFVAWWL